MRWSVCTLALACKELGLGISWTVAAIISFGRSQTSVCRWTMLPQGIGLNYTLSASVVRQSALRAE